MTDKEARREQQRMQNNREELIERMVQLMPEDAVLETLPGFRLSRLSKPFGPVHAVYQPAFCFVVQGSKQIMLGEDSFRYDPGHYLISTVELPVIVQLDEASEEKPYLGFQLLLDSSLVTSVVMESGIETKKSIADVKAMDVSAVDTDLLDAGVRLVRVLDALDKGKVLAPLIIKEIVYRLFTGNQGARLAHLLPSGGESRRISKAIGHLREHFDQQLSMENIARELGMSVSGFHHHFKSVTAMSPLQFQKQIRLQEARRLMLGEDLDAANAGFRVGYENPAHFSREYKKLFGAPPQRDIARLRSN